jgi:hypothetical protein
MLRTENGTIYYTKPHDRKLVRRSDVIVSRPKKSSQMKKELARKISVCKLMLSDTGPVFPNGFHAQRKCDLEKNERQLSNIKEGTPHKVKVSYKKMSAEKIREYVLAWIDAAKAHNINYLMAEDIAYQLRVKPHFVKQVLQQLNIEGILYQPTHEAPHDSARNHFFYGRSKEWCPNTYYFRDKEEESEEEE